jgi:acetoin utilization protein AcuB
MTAEQLISDFIIPLRTSDTGQDALSLMNEFYVRHLPIVNNEQLLGLIAEDDILNHDVEEAVGSYTLSNSRRPYVKQTDHLYEVLRLIAEYHLTVIPVVDEEENYVGLITIEALMQYFAKTASFADPGSILVIELSKRDYMLSEIARIVESEGASILSSFITTNPDSTKIEVTLKINRQFIQSVIATFQRYDYTIKATFNEREYIESLKKNYDALMTFLNV